MFRSAVLAWIQFKWAFKDAPNPSNRLHPVKLTFLYVVIICINKQRSPILIVHRSPVNGLEDRDDAITSYWHFWPCAAQHTLRHCIHAVPLNKVFLFGADTFWAFAAYAYAVQARWWLTRTLQAEMAEYGLTEREALAMAERFMYRNQYECFAHLEAGPHAERRARA